MSESSDNLKQEIDSLMQKIDAAIEMGVDIMGSSNGGITDETMTSPLPKDETIYLNNNLDHQFSEVGIEERTLEYVVNKESFEYLEKRKEELEAAKKFNPEFLIDSALAEKELIEIQERMRIVNDKLCDYKINSRFEILDL